MQRIKKGDTVEVISGDEEGYRGTVHQVLPRQNRVIVSGINLIKKHQRPTGQVRTQTGIIELEAPLYLSNVALVCRHCNERTRVGFQILPDGQKVRVCKKCGEAID
jgi:large subunit ribosomal protein L24